MANVKATDLIDFTRASKGHALAKVSYGSELVTNGTFNTDLSNWNNGNSKWTVSGSRAYHAPNSVFAVMRQSVPLTVGKIYRITFDYEVLQGQLRCQARDSSNQPNSNTLEIQDLTGTGSASVIFVPDSDYDSIGFARDDPGVTGEIYVDNVSIKEVTFDQPDGTLQLFEHPEGIPRIEYDADGNLLGLLIEEARTNLVVQSNDFNTSWSKVNVSVTSDDAVGPDGVSSADLLIASTTSAQHRLDLIPTSSAGAQTFSVYLKSEGYSEARLRIGSDGAVFDLSAKSASNISSGVTTTIQEIGNNWLRCAITVTSASANDTVRINVVENSNSTFAGDGTSGIYIYGAQLEAGSFPTSYIKTTGSTASRSADVASIDVDQFGYNQNEGTMFVEAKASGDSLTFPRVISFQDDPSNRWELIGDTTLDVRIFHRSNGTTDVSSDIISNVLDGETSFKLAYAKAENDAAGSGNGGSVVTDTSNGQLNNVDTLYIGVGANGSSDFLNGHIKSIKYYPRRLSDAQLVELTS